MKLQEAAAALRRNIAIRGKADAGVSLRSTRTSEISSFVKNCNLAETHLLRKELKIWHKDTHFEVRKLTKQQDEMYKTLLKLSRTKKEIKTVREEKKKDCQQRDHWKNSSRRTTRRNKVSMMKNPNIQDFGERKFDYLKIEHAYSGPNDISERKYQKLPPINWLDDNKESVDSLTVNNIQIFNQLATNYEIEESSDISSASQGEDFWSKKKIPTPKGKVANTINRNVIKENQIVETPLNTKAHIPPTITKDQKPFLCNISPKKKTTLTPMKKDEQNATSSRNGVEIPQPLMNIPTKIGSTKSKLSLPNTPDIKAIEAIYLANSCDTHVKVRTKSTENKLQSPVQALSLTPAHLQKPKKASSSILRTPASDMFENDEQLDVLSPTTSEKIESLVKNDDNLRISNVTVAKKEENRNQNVKAAKKHRNRIKLKTNKPDPSEELNNRSSIEIRPGQVYNVTVYKKIPNSDILEEDVTSLNTTIDVAKYFNLASHKERLRRERLLNDAREKEAQQRHRVGVFLNKLSKMEESANKDEQRRKREIEDERLRLQRRVDSIKRGPPKYGVASSLNVPSYVRKYVRPSLYPTLPQKLRKRSSWSVPSLFTLQAAAASRHVNSNLLKSSFNSSMSATTSFSVPDQSAHLVNINIEQYLIDSATKV